MNLPLIVLGAIAIFGLYIAIWLLGDAVWQMNSKIETLIEIQAQAQ